MLDILNRPSDLMLPLDPSDTELDAARAEIARLRQLNQTLLRLVGHELGSPLTVILAYLRLWQERGRADAVDELNLVMEQALLLKTRLDDLTLLEQIESGRWRIAREPVQLYPLIRRVVQNHSGKLSDKRLTLQLALGCTKTVMVDAEMMVRVLEHLLSNAYKFSPVGASITLGTHREGAWCCVHVTDQGAGISAEEQAHIFEPFYQADKMLTRRYEGMGIGLKLVRSIVEKHGGDIRVESIPGKGSTFAVRIPLA